MFVFSLQILLLPYSTMEQTYIMIKPDGVQRGLVGEIIKRFEVKGYKLVALKLAGMITSSNTQFL
jgi:nucleoside diphosphate kinase